MKNKFHKYLKLKKKFYGGNYYTLNNLEWFKFKEYSYILQNHLDSNTRTVYFTPFKENKLCNGAFGSVYRAMMVSNGIEQNVVVKLMEYEKNKLIVCSELNAIVYANTNYAMQYYDYGIMHINNKKYIYLIMDHVNGQELFDLIKEGNYWQQDDILLKQFISNDLHNF